MKKKNRLRSIRALVLSALLIASLSCVSGVMAAYAAGDSASPGAVSGSDTAEEYIVCERVEVEKSYVTYEQVTDVKNYRFKPNATYNGSFRSELLPNEIPIYDALYDTLVTQVSNATVKVDITSMNYPNSSDGADEVYDLALSAYVAFSMEHPEAYWIGGFSFGLWTNGTILTQVDITPSERYEGAYNEHETVLGNIAPVVSAISSMRASTSRYDTVKAIHDYLCQTMEYDQDEVQGATAGTIGASHTIAPLFGGGLGRGHVYVCEGYANSFKLLCDRFGIPAVMVKGTAYSGGQGGGHAWNYVQMDDGKWYGVDCTWDDQYVVMYTYFLVGSNSPGFYSLFSEDHVPDSNIMVQNNPANPLVYPPLEAEAYDPDAPVPATGITLSADAITLTTGSTETLTATVTPSGCTESVTWTSGNPSVATVSDGTVTAVAEGTAVITASVGGYSATCTVTVSDPASDLPIRVSGHSTSLEGEIGMRTALIFEEGADPSAYQVEFYVGNSLYSSTNGAAGSLSGGKYYYKVTTVARGMDTVFTLKIKEIATGEYVDFRNSNGSVIAGDTGLDYSILDYLNDRIAHSSNPKMVALAKTMYDYFLFSKHYFALVEGNSSTLPASVNGLELLDASTLASYEVTKNGAIDGFNYKSTTLNLETTTGIRMNYNYTGSGTLTITCNGETLTPKSSGSSKYVEIGNIYARNLDDVYTVTVSDGTGTFTWTNGPFGYAYWALSNQNGTDKRTALCYLMSAMYQYNQASEAYFS